MIKSAHWTFTLHTVCWRIITPLSLQVLFYATILIFPSHCPRHKEEIGCFQFYCGLNKVRQQYIFTSLLYHFFRNSFSPSSYRKTFEEKKTECTFLQLILSWVNLLKRESKIHWDSFSVGLRCSLYWPIRARLWSSWPIRGQQLTVMSLIWLTDEKVINESIVSVLVCSLPSQCSVPLLDSKL